MSIFNLNIVILSLQIKIQVRLLQMFLTMQTWNKKCVILRSWERHLTGLPLPLS